MRIGILGGTFNPIHIGHLILAEEAVAKLKLDKIIFVPTYVPPHKNIEGNVKPEHRLKMVQAAITGNPAFEVSEIEIKSKKTSYSYRRRQGPIKRSEASHQRGRRRTHSAFQSG